MFLPAWTGRNNNQGHFCVGLVVFLLPAVSVFWHLNLWALDNELRMSTDPLSGGPTNEIICRIWASQLWSVGSLFGIDWEIWGPVFVAAWWFASMALFWPTVLETVGLECCCLLWLIASPGPVTQLSTGLVLCNIHFYKIKSLHNIWLGYQSSYQTGSVYPQILDKFLCFV